jgi:hypothetical protein
MGSISTIWHIGRRAAKHSGAPNPLGSLQRFTAISQAAGTVYGLYYGVFLYKHTASLSVLALDGLFGGFGTWFGYLLGVLCIRRYGYGRCLKLAFGLWAAIAFLTALIAPHIADWFIVIAIVKALPGGMFAAAGDTIMLREVRSSARSSFYQLNLVLEFLASIVLPPLVGLLVHSADGYEWTFVVAGVLYLTALLLPARLPKPSVTLNVREVVQTFRRPLYPLAAANRTMAAGFNQLNAFVLTIIPFLLLKNEITMGLLTSGTAVVASIVALVARKRRARRQLGVGYGAYTARSLACLAFVFSWSAPAMLVWQLVGKLVTPLHDPLQQDLDVDNDSLILGKDLQKQALHINILNNTLLLVGSTTAYGAFYFITSAASSQQRPVLQVLILGYAAWRFINLTISAAINRRARMQPTGGLMPLSIRVRRALGYPLLRLRSSGVL